MDSQTHKALKIFHTYPCSPVRHEACTKKLVKKLFGFGLSELGGGFLFKIATERNLDGENVMITSVDAKKLLSRARGLRKRTKRF